MTSTSSLSSALVAHLFEPHDADAIRLIEHVLVDDHAKLLLMSTISANAKTGTRRLSPITQASR